MTAQPRRILVDPSEADAVHRLKVFYQLGMPGMTLVRKEPKPPEPEKQKPIIPRCACGQPISANRPYCRFCSELHIKRVAEKIESQEVLDQLLNDLEPGEREEALARVRPYLKF